MNRMESDGDEFNMAIFDSINGEDTPWDSIIEALTSWVWANPGGCTSDTLEDQLDLLVEEWMVEWSRNIHHADVL